MVDHKSMYSVYFLAFFYVFSCKGSAELTEWRGGAEGGGGGGKGGGGVESGKQMASG